MASVLPFCHRNIIPSSVTRKELQGIMARISQDALRRLRRDLFVKLQSLPLAYFDAHSHGELMSRFTNDIDNVQFSMEQSLIQLVSSSLNLVGAVVMMLVLSRVLLLVDAGRAGARRGSPGFNLLCG
jgi:ABC-type multidrug transport system fused ATPase/permease subunit